MAKVQDSKQKVEKANIQLRDKSESFEMELQVKDEKIQKLERMAQEQEAQVDTQNWALCVCRGEGGAVHFFVPAWCST